jgi:hypothetical protein
MWNQSRRYFVYFMSFWPGSPRGLDRKSFWVSLGYGNYIQITNTGTDLRCFNRLLRVEFHQQHNVFPNLETGVSKFGYGVRILRHLRIVRFPELNDVCCTSSSPGCCSNTRWNLAWSSFSSWSYSPLGCSGAFPLVVSHRWSIWNANNGKIKNCDLLFTIFQWTRMKPEVPE